MDERKSTLREKLNRKKTTPKKVLVVLAALIGIVFVVLRGAYVSGDEMEKQLQQNLQDVAKQNAEILYARIGAQYKLLTSLAKELDDVTEDTIEAKLEHFEIFMDDFHLKRFAFCFPGGMTYSTDGGVEDLSYREFYKRGMEGAASITGILTDALTVDDTQVNVITVPVYGGDGKVSGVFGLAYDTMAFNESLQIESFGGKGYSCIISEDGEIMAQVGEDKFKLSQNIFDDVLKEDERNEEVIVQLQEILEQEKEGSGVLYLAEKSYYYCVPVNLMDGNVHWYILTVIPDEVLVSRMRPIQINQYETSLLVGILIAVGAMFMLFVVQDNNKELMRYAYVDPLTQAANSMKFCTDMEIREKREGYLIMMGITNFSNINIVAGEDATDLMIQETWKIISSSLQKDELAGHVRDDLFLLFFTDTKEQDMLERMENISAKIKEKARVLRVYGIGAEYGVYQIAEDESIESAYSKVRIAKDFAEKKAETPYAFYSEIDRAKAQHEKHLEERFPRALAQEEFEVWYQPKYSAQDCTVVGSEALVRWRRYNGEMISPGEFIPLFERNGMIMKLDEYMFRSVCRQQKRWLEEGKKIYPVSINISRATLYGEGVEQRYAQIMEEVGIQPEYIQLEVTETVIQGHSNVNKILKRFRDMGIKILMDDFGTGASSLATLSTQCFDILKLDKSLIDHIGNKDGETLLYYIIKMGQQMGLYITAEGVEKEEQFAFLHNMKCDDIQGYYFSRPLPKTEYETMLENNE